MDFDISNGGFNQGAVIVGQDGLLYGAGVGSIFRVDPATNTYTELHALQQSTDGAAVNSRLLQTPDGLLYGAASQGGANGESGTLFVYDPALDTFTNLHDFDGALGGRTPYGGLCLADNGWLYGTTFEGGVENHGILYKYHPGTDTFQKIFDFDDMDASNCWNTLVNIGPDQLMGAIASGGLNGMGRLFTVTPSTDAVTAVHDLAILTGGSPVGSLILGNDGQLYGTGSGGGSGGYGIVFRYDPVLQQRTTLHSFANVDGGLPRGELVFAGPAVGIDEVDAPPFTVGPNPTGGLVTLHCDPAQLPLQARITDVLGRTTHVVPITRAPHVLDLGDAQGVHSITVINGMRSHTVRVVVH
jgi:uncharacterized repeat protein (TIGR03803 family)